MTASETFGIKDNSVSWFRDDLTNRNQVIGVDGVLPDPQLVQTGVPQESILGP